MQVVGMPCVACEAKITDKREARGCSACEVAFHRRCTSAGHACPKCGRDVRDTARVAEVSNQRAVAASHAKGRVMLQFATFVTLLLSFLTIALTLALAPDTDRTVFFVVRSLARLAVEVIVLLAVYNGSRGAAWFLVCCMLVAGPLFFVYAMQYDVSSRVGIGAMVFAALYLGTGLMLALSSSFWAYLDSRRSA